MTKWSVCVWDTETGEELGEVLKRSEFVQAELSADGTEIAMAADGAAKLGRDVRVWDTRTGRPLTEFLRHPAEIKLVSFSQDGARILTADTNWTVRVWDARTSRPTAEPMKHPGPVAWVRFSPDSARIVTVFSNTNTHSPAVLVWSAQTGQRLLGPLKQWDAYWLAQLSPDGGKILTSPDRFTLIVSDSETGRLLAGADQACRGRPNGSIRRLWEEGSFGLG